MRSFRDERLSFHRNTRNLGLGGNWNQCLEQSSSDLVTVFHADDRLLPNYAQTMIHTAANYPRASAFYCNAQIIGTNSKPTFSFPDFYKSLVRRQSHTSGIVTLCGDHALARLLKGWFVMCPTVCYRLSLLKSRRFSTSWKMVVDVELLAGLLLDGHELVGLPTVAYQYRRHGLNQTSLLTKELTRFEEERDIYEVLRNQADAQGWTNTAKVAAKKQVIKLNLTYCILQDLIALRFNSAKRKGAMLAELVLKT